MKPRTFESGEAPSRELIASNTVQIALMALAYEDAHPNTYVDMSDSDERKRMALEWLERYARPYRDFVDMHATETVDSNNKDALLDLWLKIKSETHH